MGAFWAKALGRVIPRRLRKVDAALLEELEERLIMADFGVDASMRFVETVERAARRGDDPLESLAAEIRAVFDGDGGPAAGAGPNAAATSGGAVAGPDAAVAGPDAAAGPNAAGRALAVADTPPTVYLFVGVNGTGKTTTIGKLAHRLVREGRRVTVAAGDTYRAGAAEQLARWADRAGADLVRGQPGGDPAAVAFDAMGAARARGADVLLIDTAGRLHTHEGLMSELAKIDRVIRKRQPGAPHETLLVLDATVGQNGLLQARQFSRCIAVTGIVLAKLDSSARGGIVVALREELGIPVRLVGVGERPGDLEPFDPGDFVQGVLAAP